MPARTGPGRSPRSDMPAEEVLEIVDRPEAAGIRIYLDGGWVVDAALEEQTRPHDDLDLVVEPRQAAPLVSVLGEKGYAVGHGEAPKSLELPR